MRPGVPDVRITDAEDSELSTYRVLAGQSVAALLVGLLSPFAFVDPTLWGIPWLGIFLSIWALRRIKKSGGTITGRKIALLGLALSVVFTAAAPADAVVYGRMVDREARQVSEQWFRLLTQDEPQKAHQLTIPPALRQPFDDRLWSFYRGDAKQRQQLEGYVKTPFIRTLLALGPKAQVRFYESIGQDRDNDEDVVWQLYAVTYEEDGEKKSFFVLMQLVRMKVAGGGAAWRILQSSGGVRPEGW